MTEKDLEKAKLNYIKQNLVMYQNNKELVTMYDEYIQEIVELFDFIMKDNSHLFYSTVFNILVEAGFFTATHKYETRSNFEELLIKPGISIISGGGECRNIACFYNDIFQYFYDYPLKLCCFDEHGTINEDTKTYGNHMINLTLYQDVIYGFDIMNHCIFKAKSDKLFEGVDINYTLEHKPNGDLLIGLTTMLDSNFQFIKEQRKKKLLFQYASKRDILSVDEFNKIVQKANEFLLERKKIFQSFLLENDELMMEIKKKMLSLK